MSNYNFLQITICAEGNPFSLSSWNVWKAVGISWLDARDGDELICVPNNCAQANIERASLCPNVAAAVKSL